MAPARRSTIIASNWKMTYGPKQAALFARSIVPELKRLVQPHQNVVAGSQAVGIHIANIGN